MGAFVWLGGAMFVGALAFSAYSYGVTWSGALPSLANSGKSIRL